MQFLDAVKRSLSNNMLKDQVEIKEEEETTAGEMLNFFMNIKKESQTYAQPDYLFSQIEKQRMPDRNIERQTPISAYRCDKSSVADVDPLYYHDTVNHKIMNFELQLSESKRQIDQRIKQLTSNLEKVNLLSNMIVKKGCFRFDEWLKSIWLLEQDISDAIGRVQQKRKGISLREAVEEYGTKGNNVILLANRKKIIEWKLAFLKDFKRNAARVIILLSNQGCDSEYYLQLLHNSNKWLRKMEQSNAHNRVSCLQSLEGRCRESLIRVRQWLTDRFINWIYRQQDNKLDFILCWMYMQIIMKEDKALENTVDELKKHLLSQISQKINNLKCSQKIGNNLLAPLTNILDKMEQLQTYMEHADLRTEQLPKMAIRLARKTSKFEQSLRKLAENYRQVKNKFVREVLEVLLTLQLTNWHSPNFLKQREIFVNKVQHMMSGCRELPSVLDRFKHKFAVVQQL